MILGAPDATYSLDKAAEIAEIYAMEAQDGHNETKSIKELLRLCREYLKKKITISYLNRPYVPGGSIRGYCIAYADRYQICLFSGQNRCWRRFVLCKELFHVILDEDRYRTMDVYGHVEEYMNKIYVPAMAGPGAVSEALAELAAMEFMFPHKRRVEIAAQNPPIDSLTTAKRFLVPQNFVEVYMIPAFIGQLKPYMDRMKKQA